MGVIYFLCFISGIITVYQLGYPINAIVAVGIILFSVVMDILITRFGWFQN